MQPKWYSLWYSGELEPLDDIWQSWHTSVVDFFAQSGLTITHFGADSVKFRSGKYLQYPRGRKRLLQAFADGDEFGHLSFLEMQEASFNTLAGDNSFCVSLNSKGVEADVRLDKYDQQLCDSFRVVAEQLFRSARLITFKTPPDIDGIPYLPCNLPAIFDRRASELSEKYIDVSISWVGSTV